NVEEIVAVNSKSNISEYDDNTPRILMSYYQNSVGPSNDIFPNAAHSDTLAFNWTRDNYGPLYMPKAGDKVELTPENYLKFRRIIEVYEGNTLETKKDGYYINSNIATHYTFKQAYYWMMGDNRHNSLDSRYWGYVPADHIVGKPVFIWMSYDKFA